MYKKRFWNEDVETMSVDDLCNLQRKRLQEAIEWAHEKTSYYRDLFDRSGLKPEDISSPGDLVKIPFTSDIETADDVPLRDRIAVPAEKIRMYHSTSGTVGAVVPIPFTQKDMEAFLQEGEARARWTMGVRPWDVVQVLTRFDCCSLGYRELGSASVLMSAGRYNTDHQIHLTQEAGVTVIEHVPSFLLSYFERMEELGIKVGSTKLRMASGVGEGWAESYKKKVESRFGMPFMTLYGAVEISPFLPRNVKRETGCISMLIKESWRWLILKQVNLCQKGKKGKSSLHCFNGKRCRLSGTELVIWEVLCLMNHAPVVAPHPRYLT
jgi:phenylacetate-CoA ligase